ncbi:MAG: hypothetical protein AAGU19_21700 [Prolixibacteraceae bacterium]
MIRNILSGILITTAMLLFTTCTKKVAFLNSSVVPAAKGSVSIKTDSNKNYILKIQVSDLAEVERLESSKVTYVVWMETDKGNFENIGQLKSATSFFSKQHQASLKTASSYKPAKVFITAESDINAQYPDKQIVLSTDRF